MLDQETCFPMQKISGYTAHHIKFTIVYQIFLLEETVVEKLGSLEPAPMVLQYPQLAQPLPLANSK